MSSYVANMLARRHNNVKLELYHTNRMIERTPVNSGMNLHWREHLVVLKARLREIENERGSYG